jgi:GNAT superfamily N-acetyltransferase
LQELIGAASITQLQHYPTLLNYFTHGLLFGPQWPSVSCLFRAFKTSDSPAVAAQHKTLGITAELSHLAVAPAYQSNGIGRQLLQEVIAAWDQQQGGALILYTTQRKALRLYESQGFEVLRERQVDGQLTVWYMNRPQTSLKQ